LPSFSTKSLEYFRLIFTIHDLIGGSLGKLCQNKTNRRQVKINNA
jgi:hypothetical protein